MGAAATEKTAVLVPDVSKDPRYVMANPETKSELAVPLIYKDKVIGVLDLEHTRRGFFSEDHKRTITTLAAQVAIALENARLYEQIARQERRLERDLSLARELQFRLLPQAMPKVAHLEVAARFAPARAIGGDMYDFVHYSLSRLGIVIGDVSGKGAPAAIYAALVSGILRSHAPIEPAPAEMLSAVNFSLSERRIEAQYICLLYAVWDDEKRTLQIANSGLPRPLYVHDGKIEIIEATGLAPGTVRRRGLRRASLQDEARRHVRVLQRRNSRRAQPRRRNVRAQSGVERVIAELSRSVPRLRGDFAVPGGCGTCVRRGSV